MSLMIPLCNRCGRNCITGLCSHCGNGYDVLAKIAKEREAKKKRQRKNRVETEKAKIIDILLIVECPICECLTHINKSDKTLDCPDCETKLNIPHYEASPETEKA